jgi:phage/plasmid-associated DNA primase
MTTYNEYIYLLQEREFIKTNEPVYKIGKTTQENTARFNNYPKGSKLLFQIICNNCHNNEKEIKKSFIDKYKQRKDIGLEYFEGDYKAMIKDIFDIIFNKEYIKQDGIPDANLDANENFEYNENIFICNNGFLDLERCIFKVREFKEQMPIFSNIEFPNSTDTEQAHKYLTNIQEWLDKIFPDEEIQNYIMNILACSLSGDISIPKEHFYVCTGSGYNGKAQFFKLLKEIFGNYYFPINNKLMKNNIRNHNDNDNSPDVANLKSKRIVIMPEQKDNKPFDNDKLNDLISRKPLTYIHLNKTIQFIPSHSLFLKCNEIPNTEIITDGFFDKIIIIPFESKFIVKAEEHHKLVDKVNYPNHFIGNDHSHLFKEWAPYLLYLLFERYKILKESSFIFPIPEKIRTATRQYQEEASPYTQFFFDKLEDIPGYKVDATTLYAEFQAFVGRDFKTQKPIFLKQMECMIGKPRGKKQEYYGFRIFNRAGELIDSRDSIDSMDSMDIQYNRITRS